MTPVVTMIVVANGAKARFYRHDGPGKGLEHMAGLDMDVKHPPARDLVSDRPGRAFESATHGRSAMEPKSDPRELAEAEFVRSAAVVAEKAAAEIGASRVVVCADPTSLGTLRKAMPPALATLVTAEIAKNLTDIPARDLPKHLEDVLAV